MYSLAIGQRAFAYRGAKMHNTLFKDIRHGKSYRFLKRGFLKIFLIHRQSFITEMCIVFKINVLLLIVVVVL